MFRNELKAVLVGNREEERLAAIAEEKKGTFGPRPMLILDLKGNDETISFLADIGFTRLPNVIAGMLSFCSTSGYDAGKGTNFGYAYKFLYDYVCNEWLGIPQSYELHAAPRMIWTIIDACKPKKFGPFSFRMQGTPTTIAAATVSQMGNTPFGRVTSSTFGYTILDTSLAAYTAALGYAAVNVIFEDLSEALDVIDKPEDHIIADDDFSAYVSIQDDQSNPMWGKFRMNGVDWKNNYLLKWIRPPKTEWLGRLMLAPITMSQGTYSVMTTCPPSSIVVDRLLTRIAPHKKTRRTVILKNVNVCDILSARDVIVRAADSQEAYTSTSGPFATAGLGFDDYKFMSYALISRHFTRWLSVASGYLASDNGYIAAMRCGNGDYPTIGTETVKNFQFVENALSGLYPYARNRDNLAIYPVPYLKTDITTGPSSLSATDSILTAAWNWLTGFVSANLVCAFQVANMMQLIYVWNRAVGGYQAVLPISGALPRHKINSASFTNHYVPNSSNGICNAQTSLKSQLPLDIQEKLSSLYIPVFWPNAESTIDSYCVVTGEYFKQGLEDILGLGSVVESTRYESAWISTLHKLGGQGSSDAYAMTEAEISEESYEPENIVSAVTEGAANVATNLVLGAVAPGGRAAQLLGAAAATGIPQRIATHAFQRAVRRRQ